MVENWLANRRLKAAGPRVAFDPVAVGVGAITGALIKTDHWEDVPLDRVRVSFGPQRDGRFALGASVRF